jgi:hypothetical protein
MLLSSCLKNLFKYVDSIFEMCYLSFSDRTPTSITSTQRAASIRARFAKKKYFAPPLNTIRGQAGPPFMTLSAKTRLPLDKMLQEVSTSMFR